MAKKDKKIKVDLTIQKRKKPWKIIIPIAVVVILIIWFVGMYNGLVRTDETVNEKWGNVESTYQRRVDLIPNLIETVKGYAAHEEDLFKEITAARSAWMKAKTPKSQVAAANQVEGALGKLMLVVENYPNLKANENFLALQDELSGTENRINVARQRYNEAVKAYNVKTRRFPTNLVANMFGFAQKEMFEADEGADKVPEVKF